MSRPHADTTPDEPSIGRDLARFGSILDRVIRDTEAEAVAEAVDAGRRASAEHQEHARQIAAGTRVPSDDSSRLSTVVSGRGAMEAEALCRAFLCHLHLIELAEEAQSLREGRAKSPTDSWSEIREPDSNDRRLAKLLDAWGVEVVLAVHPCRVSSVTLLRLDQDILKLALEPAGAEQDARALELITDLWRSTPYVVTRPTTREQREHLLFMLTESVYGACPEVVDRVSRIHDHLRACGETSEEPGRIATSLPPSLPPDISWATWVGGDMDANPYVTADTLKSSLAFHREAVLSLYSRDLVRLEDQIAAEHSELPDPGEVLTRVRAMSERLDGTRSAPQRGRSSYPQAAAASLEPHVGPYGHPDELARDLAAVRRILEQAIPDTSPARAARRLEQRVGMFGFHLVRLNQRQDSALHRDVIGQLMIDDRWAERPSSSRIRRLRQMIPKAKRRSTPPGSPAFVHQSLAVFRALEDARQRGIQDGASGPFVISLAEGPDDLLSVLLLARWGGLIVDGQVPLDVAPLFETVEDLQNAPQILDQLLGLEVYRRHLAARQNRQIVMLSMADLNRDSGFFTAGHQLVAAQQAMARAVAKHEGLELTFLFDSSDPLWRHGGTAALSPRLAVTEPGATLSDRFLVPELVHQTVESNLAIGLGRALRGAAPQAATTEDREASWSEVVATASQAAMESYRDLIFGERKLYRYYRLATPVDVIERLMIGSRSSSRRTHAGVANVRPTPWKLAWALSRHGLPGWFGLGSGLQRAIDVLGAAKVGEAASSCPVLSQLLRRAELTLAWTDLEIAEQFSDLAGDLSSQIFPRIAQEHVLTLEILRELLGENLFATDMQGVERRRPYVDSISRLQLDLLRRWREGSREDDQLLKALLASVGGAFQGLKPIL